MDPTILTILTERYSILMHRGILGVKLFGGIQALQGEQWLICNPVSTFPRPLQQGYTYFSGDALGSRCFARQCSGD